MIENEYLLPTQAPALPPILPVGPPIVQKIHETGERTLWVVVVLMAVSSLCFYVLAARALVQKRLLHVLTALITTISFLAYLALATGDGITWSQCEYRQRHPQAPDTEKVVFRQVFWARYVNWGLTHPLILINLALLAGSSGYSMLVAIAADLIMFTTGLIATFARHERRWAWYTITCIAYLTVAYHVLFNGRRAVANKSQQTQRFFGSIALTALVITALYPIILAASPLAHKISLDAEVIAWAILDILTQGIFGYWLLLTLDNSDTTSVYCDGFWAFGHGTEGSIRVGDHEEA